MNNYNIILFIYCSSDVHLMVEDPEKVNIILAGWESTLILVIILSLCYLKDTIVSRY